jgi:DoxX-like family
VETVLLVILAVVFAGAGAVKVLGVAGTKANFERWATPEWSRPVVGAIELLIAGLAVAGLNGNASGTQLAALLGLWTMVGALVIHGMAGDPPKEIAPALVVLLVAVGLLITTT